MEHGLRAATQEDTLRGCAPSTTPRVDHASAVRNVLALARRAYDKGVPTEALPMACLSEHGRGEQLAEMHDMSEAGAVAFSDDASIDRVSLLQRALTYSNVHGKAVVDLPLDRDMNPGGLMHEGVTSTEMGLTGIPAEQKRCAFNETSTLPSTLKVDCTSLWSPRLKAWHSFEMPNGQAQGHLWNNCGTPRVCDEDLAGFEGTYACQCHSARKKIEKPCGKAFSTAPLTSSSATTVQKTWNITMWSSC